jgi:hypothetical protein
MVIVALADELLAWLASSVTLLLKMGVSATELATSPAPDRINAASRIARMAGTNGFLTWISSQINYTIART